MRRLAHAAVLLIAAVVAPPAAADDKAAAEALFQDGRRLSAEGKLTEACAKFAASFQAEASIGAMLNLARCHEQTGKTASAWAEYTEAEALARRAGEQKTADAAAQQVRALETKLLRLTLRADRPTPNMRIERDGVLVPEASLGVAIPIDPGEHRIQVTAPGHRSWTTQVVSSSATPSLVVHLPALEPEERPPATPLPKPSAPPPRRGDGDHTSPLVFAGIAVGATGVIGLALGAGFGIAAIDGKSDLERQCPQQDRCGRDGLALRDDLSTQGDVSTAAFLVGGVLVAAGATMILLAPSSRSGGEAGAHSGRIVARLRPGSLDLLGTF